MNKNIVLTISVLGVILAAFLGYMSVVLWALDGSFGTTRSPILWVAPAPAVIVLAISVFGIVHSMK